MRAPASLPVRRWCIRKVRRDIVEHLRSEPAALLQARVRASSLAQVGLLERAPLFSECFRHAMHRNTPNGIAFGSVQRSELGLADAYRVFQHGLKNRLKLAG